MCAQASIEHLDGWFRFVSFWLWFCFCFCFCIYEFFVMLCIFFSFSSVFHFISSSFCRLCREYLPSQLTLSSVANKITEKKRVHSHQRNIIMLSKMKPFCVCISFFTVLYPYLFLIR